MPLLNPSDPTCPTTAAMPAREGTMAYFRALAADPEILQIGLDIWEIMKFIDLARYLKPYIASNLRVANLGAAPPHLPVNIHDFFKLSLGITDEATKIAWDCLHTAIWEDQSEGTDDPITAFSSVSKYTEDFVDYGITRFIGTPLLY